MKRLLLFWIITLCCGYVAAELNELKVVEISSMFEPVEIEAPKTRKKNNRKEQLTLPYFTTCSGAFVSSDGAVLTARHCVDGAEAVSVQTYDHRTYRAEIVAISTRHDLALLRVDRRYTPYFVVASSATRGEDIYILGSPLAITNILAKGVIAGIKGDLFHVDCSALPGNSGGPVINSRDEMVGIVISSFIVFMGPTHLNTAQGPDSIYFFLKETLDLGDDDDRPENRSE